MQSRGRRGPKPDVAGQKRRFLTSYRNAGTVRRACERAKVHRADVEAWLDPTGPECDPQFRCDYQMAFEDFIDSILEKMIALARGELRQKQKPNFTALVALLNAFHGEFDRLGQEKLEKRMFDFVDRVARVAARYVPPQDLEKFREECAAEMDAALLSIPARKGRRE